jgi:hypothetical protein
VIAELVRDTVELRAHERKRRESLNSELCTARADQSSDIGRSIAAETASFAAAQGAMMDLHLNRNNFVYEYV